MAAAGVHPAPDRHVDITRTASFYDAFVSITNPVFSYAGHCESSSLGISVTIKAHRRA